MYQYRLILLVCSLFLLRFDAVSAESPEPKIVRSWDFHDEQAAKDWGTVCDLENITHANGIYRATVSGNDPFFISPLLDFPANGFQYVEIRLKTNSGGQGELFFTGNLEGQHGGFSQQKSLTWTALGDDCWHVYRIYPDWLGEGTIRKIRIDFPIPVYRDGGKPTLEISSIRIAEPVQESPAPVQPNWTFSGDTAGWHAGDQTTVEKTGNGWKLTSQDGTLPTVETGLIAFEDGKRDVWLSLELQNNGAKTAKIEWVCDLGKVGTFELPLRKDKQSHWYNFDISKRKIANGKTHWMKITLAPEGGVVKALLLSDKPQGPADLEVEKIWFSEPINRMGKTVPVSIRLKNFGGQPTTDSGIRDIVLSRNLGVSSERKWNDFPVAEPMQTVTHTIDLEAIAPGEAKVSLRLTGETASKENETATTTIYPNLNLPKADYVPEPKPVRSEYEIGAFYFPGWAKASQWERIRSTYPERKPVLGWYDEGNPEVIDWQIKWAVENGMQFFLVDWYWSAGHQQLDHWVNGFQKARYKSYLKWAVMWANHNGPGSHSEEDQEKVTRFWIDNYFKTPEYYQIDGKPVVMIWSPEGMDNDIIALERAKGNELKKGEGVKKLLNLSRKAARDAGLKGIYFIAMKWPEASNDAKDIQWLADAGFDMTSIYHYMDHGAEAVDPRRFPFELVVKSSLKNWQGSEKTGILPFLPNLSTGWDSRPWHGYDNIIIDDRTVDQFRRICRDYVHFASESGVKRFAFGPLNEWGEGSYIEPNLEYGFGMYETIREVFCEKPSDGWPLNFTPSDVGLGPYDLE